MRVREILNTIRKSYPEQCLNLQIDFLVCLDNFIQDDQLVYESFASILFLFETQIKGIQEKKFYFNYLCQEISKLRTSSEETYREIVYNLASLSSLLVERVNQSRAHLTISSLFLNENYFDKHLIEKYFNRACELAQ